MQFIYFEVKSFFAFQLTQVDLLDDINGGSSVTDVELLRERLQQHPMRFAWVDGSIERVCQEDDDHVFAVNIKRGILSSIQNSMTSFDSPREIEEVRIFPLQFFDCCN